MVTYAELDEFQLPLLPLQALTAHTSAVVSLPFPLKFVDITSTDRLHFFRTGRTDAAIKGALALLHGAKVPLGRVQYRTPLTAREVYPLTSHSCTGLIASELVQRCLWCQATRHVAPWSRYHPRGCLHTRGLSCPSGAPGGVWL